MPAGEKGRSVLEMTWSRPTCEVNGMGGGYQGAGFKTVIPAQAMAKISFRLVFDQDPHKIRAAFREHVKARLPADCTVEFHEHGSGTAVAFDTSGPVFQKTQGALSDEWGKEAAFVGGGGSIPVTTLIKNTSASTVVMVGFGLDRRPHPQPEREVRAQELPQGHPLLGARAGRLGRLRRWLRTVRSHTIRLILNNIGTPLTRNQPRLTAPLTRRRRFPAPGTAARPAPRRRPRRSPRPSRRAVACSGDFTQTGSVAAGSPASAIA